MAITALALCFLCNIFILSSGLFNISRFGLKTHFYSNSGPDGSFNLTLYWNSQIQICQFINPVNKASDEYICDKKSNIVILEQQQPHQYKFKIDYKHTSVFRVDTLFVEDLRGNRYSMDTFCGARQFYYWDGGSVYDTTTETLCDSPWNDKFNYSFFKLDTATTKLNTLYVSFAGNISDANNIIGIISPAYIKSFAVRISNYSLQPVGKTKSFHIIQTILFWDIYSYLCAFSIDKNKKVYECDDARPIKTNKTRFAFEIVNNNHNNILFIDHIFIKDYSDLPYQYNISIFSTYTSFDYINLFATNPWNGICVGNTFDQPNSNGNNMLQFPEFCIDSCSCGYNKFIIDFPMELILNVEKSQCGFVHPINDDISTCTPVVWTSTSSYSSTDRTTSTLVILPTDEDVQPQISMTLILALIVICVLVFVLILGGIYVKKLKKYIPSDNDYKSLPGSELTSNEISHNSAVAPGVDSEEVVDNDEEGDGPILNRDITQSQTEGYNKITKVESSVDLQIIQGDDDDSKNDKITNDGGNDNGNIMNENNIEKDHVLLDGMLSDVLQMKSLDPNKVHEMNENNVKKIETDSDDSDNMYDEIGK